MMALSASETMSAGYSSSRFCANSQMETVNVGHHAVELPPIAALAALADRIALPPGGDRGSQRNAHQLVNANLRLPGKLLHLFRQRVGHLRLKGRLLVFLSLAKTSPDVISGCSEQSATGDPF